MIPSKEAEQRKEFCDILFELARSQEYLQDAHHRSQIYMRLERLYDADLPENRFRHFYSDIFSVLTQIQQNPALGDINILGQNLDIIRSGYNPKNKTKDGNRIIDISDAIKKLYDHVNLDIARISYSDGADRQISGKSSLENLHTQIKNIKGDCQIIQKELTEVENKLNNSQKEYISILGIFAAVVLAFTGGIAFSTSVLNNIAKASIYRTITIALIIGLVLINILFGLFYYINSLVNKNQKMLPLIVSNIILITLLIVTIAAWNFGWVENREKRIRKSPDSQISILEEEYQNTVPEEIETGLSGQTASNATDKRAAAFGRKAFKPLRFQNFIYPGSTYFVSHTPLCER